ncbi:MAG: SDR family oxidoreductase [Candidatus Limnocylindrales bacterium]|nr:SDR family oxidoreductase [Candidatus Limnocylindrales bacterium]
MVVVTGAAGGVGRATVRAFHEDSWYVVGVDRLLNAEVPGADLMLGADVSDESGVERAFRELTRIGSIDALINNAAIQVLKNLVETTPAEWDTVMASNVRSAYLTIRAAYPLMRNRASAIVNVGSVHAVATSPGLAAYAASKGALVALTRAAALELAVDGIRVNAVLPGAVDTPMLRAGLLRAHRRTEEEGIVHIGSRTPLGRVAQPEEIAQSVLFLADPARSSFMTGQVLVVDGGATAHLSTE